MEIWNVIFVPTILKFPSFGFKIHSQAGLKVRVNFYLFQLLLIMFPSGIIGIIEK